MSCETSVTREHVRVPRLHVRHSTHFKNFIPCVSHAPNMLLAGGLEAKNLLGWCPKDCPTPSIPVQGSPAPPKAIRVGGWEERKGKAEQVKSATFSRHLQGQAPHARQSQAAVGCLVRRQSCPLGTCGQHVCQ